MASAAKSCSPRNEACRPPAVMNRTTPTASAAIVNNRSTSTTASSWRRVLTRTAAPSPRAASSVTLTAETTAVDPFSSPLTTTIALNAVAAAIVNQSSRGSPSRTTVATATIASAASRMSPGTIEASVPPTATCTLG